MKVLHIGKYYPPVVGGIENFMGDLLPALAQTGVITAALVHQGTMSQPEKTEQNITYVPSYGQLLYVPIAPGFPIALTRILARFKPDIIHIHMPNPSAFWLLNSKKAKQIPWVIHWHSDVVSSKIDTRLTLAYKLYRPFEQALLKCASKVIVTTPNYLETSLPLYKWHDKCTVIPLGINPDRLKTFSNQVTQSVAEKYHLDQGKFKIIVIGRLTYYKGHGILIEAAKQLSGVQILIVGTGDKHRDIKQRIRHEKLHDTILLAGHVPHDELHSLIQNADCLCLPSIERTEAFGLVLLEAMRYAKPIIATSVKGAGMNWVIRNNQTGLLVPPADPTALAHGIKRLMNSPKAAQQLGQAGKQRFDKWFHINQVSTQIKKVYEEILNRVK